jgi:hypothetical protein
LGLKEHKEHRDLQVDLDQQGQKVHKDQTDQQVPQDHKVHKEHKDLQDLQEHLDLQGHKEHKGLKEQDHKERQELQVPQDLHPQVVICIVDGVVETQTLLVAKLLHMICGLLTQSILGLEEPRYMIIVLIVTMQVVVPQFLGRIGKTVVECILMLIILCVNLQVVQ